MHASHDLVLHRPLRAGVDLETRATISRVEQRPAGAYQVVRLDTCDSAGAQVCTTWYGSVFRGVPVIGGDRALGDELEAVPPIGSDAAPRIVREVPGVTQSLGRDPVEYAAQPAFDRSNPVCRTTAAAARTTTSEEPR